MNKTRKKKEIISKELAAEWDALPNGAGKYNKVVLTPQEEALVRKYYPLKRKIVIAQKLGISRDTLRRLAKEMGIFE
jgi:hypothetical protein